MHIVNNTKNARLYLVILLAFLDSLYVVFCLKVDFFMLEISLMTSVIVSFNLYMIFDYVRICCEYNVGESWHNGHLAWENTKELQMGGVCRHSHICRGGSTLA